MKRKASNPEYFRAIVWEPSLDKKPTRTFINEDEPKDKALAPFTVKCFDWDVQYLRVWKWDNSFIEFYNMPFTIETYAPTKKDHPSH